MVKIKRHLEHLTTQDCLWVITSATSDCWISTAASRVGTWTKRPLSLKNLTDMFLQWNEDGNVWRVILCLFVFGWWWVMTCYTSRPSGREGMERRMDHYCTREWVAPLTMNKSLTKTVVGTDLTLSWKPNSLNSLGSVVATYVWMISYKAGLLFIISSFFAPNWELTLPKGGVSVCWLISGAGARWGRTHNFSYKLQVELMTY